MVPVAFPQRILALSLKTHKFQVELYSLILFLSDPKDMDKVVTNTEVSNMLNCKLNLYLPREMKRPIPLVI